MATSTVTSSFSRSTISAFWTKKTQMEMANAAIAGLVLEGIENPLDLYEYSKGEMESILRASRSNLGR